MLKKIGPLLVMFSGLVAIVFATLGLLASLDVISNLNWLGDYTTEINNRANETNTTANVVYGISIAAGVIQIILAKFALSKPRGIAAIVVFGMVVLNIVLNVIGATRATDGWPVVTIINISILAVATLGMLFGFFQK
ncbi:MAG: hypothetical protein NC236_01945 [Mycoplasma sp.]|nr:hypothetical protein [Mycoplasma sp.]